MIQKFSQIKSVNGTLNLPGDKSISHRSVMFSALAEGTSEIYNYLESADINSTIDCFRKMGCNIVKTEEKIVVAGRGKDGLQAPTENLDCGNSGTTARLITGILAAQKFESTLVGDESLSLRPMKRVVDPLTEMGAKFKANEKITLPLTILPSDNFHAIEYELPVASAQVKSCILLGGLFLDDTTRVIEKEATRNHTENLLGLDVQESDGKRTISISNKNYPSAGTYNVPSDVSTAAFFIVLASVLPDSELRLNNVLLNKTRCGIISVMKDMGADISIENEGTSNGELAGDLLIKSAKLKNCEIKSDIIANIIDEIPILSIAGIFAEGNFVIRNASELRVKETDRIESVCSNLRLLGLNIKEYDDGFEVSGGITNKEELTFNSYGDHRIAMAFGILSVILQQGGKVENFGAVEVSNPKFIDQLKIIAQ